LSGVFKLIGSSLVPTCWYLRHSTSLFVRRPESSGSKLYSTYGEPGQKYRDYSALGQITGLCPCKVQAQSGTRLAGQPSLLGCDPYIYSGSQRVCAILIRCFSGPSASEAIVSILLTGSSVLGQQARIFHLPRLSKL